MPLDGRIHDSANHQGKEKRELKEGGLPAWGDRLRSTDQESGVMGDMDSAPGFVSRVCCVTLGKSCDLSSSLLESHCCRSPRARAPSPASGVGRGRPAPRDYPGQ